MKMVERFRTRNPAVGTLYLTTTHLIFVDNAGKRETWVSDHGEEEEGCVVTKSIEWYTSPCFLFEGRCKVSQVQVKSFLLGQLSLICNYM